MQNQKYTVTKLQRGPTSKVIFSIIRHKSDNTDIVSQCINLDNLAQVHAMFKPPTNTYESLQMSMKMKKTEQAENLTLPIDIICEDFQDKFYCSQNWMEVKIIAKSHDCSLTCNHYSNGYSNNKLDNVYKYTFEVDITIQAIPTIPIASTVTKHLYSDDEFTSFQLQGTDGVVPIHRSMLIAHSVMARTMLRSGDWEESKNGTMKIDGATTKTLQDLKAYMYLGILPDENLEPLLLIASCYLMDTLKTDCIAKLVSTVKPEDIGRLIKFSCENNMPDLVKAILFQASDTVVTKAYQLEIESKIGKYN